MEAGADSQRPAERVAGTGNRASGRGVASSCLLSVSRIGLCGGAVFAAVGNKYIIIDNLLPPTAGFTLSDVIEMTSFAAILLSIIVVAALHIMRKQCPSVCTPFNYITAAFNFAFYISVNGTEIMRAMSAG